MTWRYGVMKHPDGTFAVHEIYLDKKGNPDAWTEEPVDLGCFEDLQDLKGSLLAMMNDVENFPVLDYTKEVNAN
jgi:hypothetical protein